MADILTNCAVLMGWLAGERRGYDGSTGRKDTEKHAYHCDANEVGALIDGSGECLDSLLGHLTCGSPASKTFDVRNIP